MSENSGFLSKIVLYSNFSVSSSQSVLHTVVRSQSMAVGSGSGNFCVAVTFRSYGAS
jgi:hypothetical protein